MKDRVFPCACHGFHFMRFTAWPASQPDFAAEAYVSVGGDFRDTWKDRVKGAWHVLRGGNAHSCEILLDARTAAELRDALGEYLTGLYGLGAKRET